MQGLVGAMATVHAHHAEKQRVRAGQRSQPFERCHHRCLQHFHESAKLGLGMRLVNAAACINNWPSRSVSEREPPRLPPGRDLVP